nr:DNA/RNA non-specific endonuclease [Pediococcus pentosaceus]
MNLILCNNPTIKVEAKTVIKYTHPHERDITYYLKQDKNHYVRYRVTPVFKGNNLLAQEVQMEARSVGNNSIKFNIQDDVKLNYLDGTSKLK